MNLKTSMVLLVSAVLLTVYSCQKADNVNPAIDKEVLAKKGGNGKGSNGKGNQTPEEPEEPVVEYESTYRITTYDDPDPLYQFSFSTDGALVLLETDPTITTWGTDYWGFWASPFAYSNGVMETRSGLTETRIEFRSLANGDIDVYKRLIRHPYLNGTSDTMYFHPGVYTRVQ